MVSLPAIDTYSKNDEEALIRHSPIYNHYKGLLDRKTSSFSDEIRVIKHRYWLECALATFSNQHPTSQICQYWTDKTEEILQKVWSHCELESEPVTLLAFGKLGSRELNLSSDIDIVFVRSNEADSGEIGRKLKKFIQILTEKTAFGFCYRVDLNLRPGGDQSPFLPNKENFFSYFNEYLEAWNRVSFIRMRPILGHPDLGKQMYDYCHALAYPRRLDFSVISEIKSIRSKINYQWKKAHEPLDIKICPGGIRDIELFVQSLQVIYGGKNSDVQTPSMIQAMDRLTSIGALKENDKDFLNNFYWQLRHIENLIHIAEDKHTYRLEKSFWTHAGELDTDNKTLHQDLEKSHRLISEFFEEPPRPSTNHSIDLSDLTEAGKKAIRDIQNLKSHSLKKTRVEEIKNNILQNFLSYQDTIALDKNLALQSFRDFVFAIKSKSSIFHLLERHPKLLEDLSWLFSISPFVGLLLSRRPELIDSFALGQVAINDADDMETMLENLIDYKMLGQLSAIVSLVRTKDIVVYCRQLTEQADFIVTKLNKVLQAQTGAEPIDILCMGKWSGFELGIQSDLDFVFLTDGTPTQKQLKMARRLINLLTNHTRGGKLFNVDLRLKPNENAGPLILSKDNLYDFIENKAEAWQKQAYLRTRLLNTETFYLKDHFKYLRVDHSEVEELEKIHHRVLTSNLSDSIDVKSCHGGIVHTEFTLQKLCLRRGRAPRQSSTTEVLLSLDVQPEIGDKILKNYSQIRKIEQLLQICNDNSRTKVSKGQSNTDRVARILGTGDFFSHLKDLVTDQQHILKDLT